MMKLLEERKLDSCPCHIYLVIRTKISPDRSFLAVCTEEGEKGFQLSKAQLYWIPFIGTHDRRTGLTTLANTEQELLL